MKFVIFTLAFVAFAYAATMPRNDACPVPECSNTTTLFPHENPTRFWQCAPEAGCDAWKAVAMPCPPGLYFRNDKQVCDWCNDHICDSGRFVNKAPKC